MSDRKVRKDLIAINSELRFNFKEKIEIVYRDYLKFLLLNEPNNLSQVVNIYESLQLAELENFLRCGRLISASDDAQQDELVIYIINLEDFIEVIASSSKGYSSYRLPADQVLPAAQNLVLNIQSPSFLTIPESDFLPYAQSLYTDLIAPLQETFLSSTTPLTFVLDYPFQSIPMGILHDGNNYLIAGHAISNSLRLSRASRENKSSQALFAGLIQETISDDPRISNAALGPLLETEFEAESLKSAARSKILLDKEFTGDRLQRALSTEAYGIVHLSTHGQFSSAPEATYLVAWDELLSTQDLARTFQGSRSDLLVLSACQTASGDERAVLGLSGVAVQAGAHSAIASLWLVDATGNSVLIDLFYEELAKGIETAEALHRAQLNLLESTAFKHPFYWAPFLLVKEF